MKLTTAVQEALLAILCYDEKEGTVVSALVESKHFDPVYREVAEKVLDYRQEWKKAPGTHTLDLIQACIEEDTDRDELYERLFSSLKKTSKTINAKYIVERTRAFVRFQTMKRALATAARELTSETEEGLVKAEAVIAEAIKPKVDVLDLGTSYLTDIPASLRFLERPDAAFPTGIKELDERDLGPIRKRLHLFVAPAKRGKSWWLIQIAKHARMHAKKVVFLSLELDENEVCRRLTQSFFAVSKRQVEELKYKRFVEVENKKDWGSSWDTVRVSNVDSFYDEKIRSKLVRQMKQFGEGERLIVKEFPMGKMTPKNLEAYLDMLEVKERFIPDLLVVDYLGIMKKSPKVERWESMIENAEALKRIAQERDIAVASANQSKASAAKAKRIDVDGGGGAWDLIATADTVMTYGQTDEERSDGLARLFVAAARTEQDRIEIAISQHYGIGQFALSSILLGERASKRSRDDDEDREVKARA